MSDQPPAAAPSPVPKAARIHQVFSWILSGATEHDVLEAIQTAWPDAKARPLVVAALKQLKESSRIDSDLAVGFCVEATRDLYRRMVEIGDFSGALKAIKQLGELARKHGTVPREETQVGQGPAVVPIRTTVAG